jgi:integrase
MTQGRITVQLHQPGDRPHFKFVWFLPGTTTRKSRTSGTSDPEKAEKLRGDLEYELNHGMGATAVRLQWEAFSDRYLEQKLGDRRKRTRAKWSTVSASFHRLMRPRSIADVDAGMLSAYAVKLRETGFVKPTVAGHLAYLRAALKWAARQSLLPSAPIVEMPKLPKKSHIRRTDNAGFLRILNAAPEDWRPFISCAWHTGMRRGELLELEWSDVNTKPWVDLGRARIWLPAEWCKSDADSWLPVHPDLLATLTPLVQPSGRVFNLTLSPNELSRTFTAIAIDAGVPITLHDLRRSFGCRYAPLVPAAVLQRLMRHADVRTTLKFYVDTDDVLEEAIRKA